MPCSLRFLLPRGRLASIGIPCALLLLILLPSPVEAEQVLPDRTELRYDQHPAHVRSRRGKIQRRKSIRRKSARRWKVHRRTAMRHRPAKKSRSVVRRRVARRPTARRHLRVKPGASTLRSVAKKLRRSSARPSRRHRRSRSLTSRPKITRPPSSIKARSAPRTTEPSRAAIRSQQTKEPKPARAPKTQIIEERRKIEKPVAEAYQPNSPWASANRWRGLVRRRVAEASPGLPARTEIYPNLGMLLRSLPDDGEVRVRNGIYVGRSAYAHEERLPEENRNVQVECWLHGVRQDTTNLKFEGNIELLLGTTDDPGTSRFMIAELPAGRDLPGEPGTFEPLRRRLHALLGSYPIRSEFRRMIPIRIVVEGSLFFDGWRGLTSSSSATGPSAPQPGTVWEIQPLVAIE